MQGLAHHLDSSAPAHWPASADLDDFLPSLSSAAEIASFAVMQATSPAHAPFHVGHTFNACFC